MQSGRIVAEARNKKKMTQAELAQRCGIEQSYISHWERNRALPSPEIVKKVATHLDIDQNILIRAVEIDHQVTQRRKREARYGLEELPPIDEIGMVDQLNLSQIQLNNYGIQMLKYFNMLPERVQETEVERLRIMVLGYKADNEENKRKMQEDRGEK